ncbi:MAG TPA: hypothetical protein VFG73_06860 [Rhodanobacteraceae bacterium]|nr:hypothetical protein [Rhodanobacteraceae bacterium]
MSAVRCTVAALLAAASLLVAAAAQAATPVTFNFTFEALPPSTAKVVGQITFNDRTIFFRPVRFSGEESYENVTALSMTVTGTGANDGTFERSDFRSVYFESRHGFDLGHDLVGQYVPLSPVSGWGIGCNGEFGFDPATARAPLGGSCNWLTVGLGSAEGDVMMRLTSMRPVVSAVPPGATPAPVPADGRWALLALALLLGLGALRHAGSYASFRRPSK